MNIIAIAAMAVVAYTGLVHGLYRSAQNLAVCVLSGVIAFGLMGPATGFLPTNTPRGTWYFGADAFCLWALFCFSFLLLRTLAEKLLPNEPGFPPLLDQLGGAAFGIATGYLTVGVCMLLVQMLPTSPDLLGYEAFQFKRGEDGLPDSTTPGRPLWLPWDRGTLAFFGRLSSHPMGSDETSFFRRYGDVYPPVNHRGEGYTPVLDEDDFLYFYWYRRHEFIGPGSGPVPAAPVQSSSREQGLRLVQGQAETVSDVSVRLSLMERLPGIDTFPQEKPPEKHEFLLLTVRFKPAGRLPRTIDSSQFYLLDTLGPRIERPMVLGRANGQPQNHIVPEYAKPSVMTARAARFNIPPSGADGFYLASGAAFAFTQTDQWEQRTLVFTVPKQRSNDKYRLNVHTQPPAAAAPGAPATREAKPSAPKPATAAPAVPATPAAKTPGA